MTGVQTCALPIFDITGRQPSDATPATRTTTSPDVSTTPTPSVSTTVPTTPAQPVDELGGLYQKYFGRAPEPEGREYWSKSGLTGEDLARSVLGGAQKADYDYYMAQLVGQDTSGGTAKTTTDAGTTTTATGETVTGGGPSTTTEQVSDSGDDGSQQTSDIDERTRQILQLISDSSDHVAGDGADGGEEETQAKPTDPSQKRVVTSPIYIDPALQRRQARAAPTAVVSAGADPATSGVVLGKYGKKDQVWNEATLRLADALGIR